MKNVDLHIHSIYSDGNLEPYQIIDVAILASETVLNREINHDDNSRLVDDFIKDIEN